MTIDGTDRRDRVLGRIHELMVDPDRGFEAKLEALLEEGRTALDVEYGALARVEGDRYELRAVAGADETVVEGLELSLGETYCERVVDSRASLSFGSVEVERPELLGRGAARLFGLACYLGAPVRVDDEVWGTLCFFDRGDRSGGFEEWEETVVELVASWAGHELTHRRRNAELEDARATLQRTLERIDDGFFALDGEWKFTYVNDRAHELINPEDRRLLGERVWDAFPEAVGMTFEERYREAMADQRTVSFEEYFPPLDRWFEVTAYPSDSGLSVFFSDVTGRKRRERELARYETIVESVDDGVIVIDEGQFVAVNDAYATLLGYEPAELVGTAAEAVVGDAAWAEWTRIEAELRRGERERATMEVELVTRDGGSVPVEASITRVPEVDGSFGGYVCVVRDVTERRRREAVLGRLLSTTRALFAPGSPRVVAETVVEAAEEVFGYEFVGVRLYEEETDALQLVAATDSVRERLADRGRVEPGESPMWDAFVDGETLVIEDVRVGSPHEYGPIRGAMCLPLGTHGVLTVGARTVDAFDATDVQLAEVLAENVAAALGRADREAALRRHERVLESVEGMVYAADGDDRLTLVTQPLADRVGWSRAALLGEPVSTVIAADSVADHRSRLAAVRSESGHDHGPYELGYETADGDRIPVEVELSALPDGEGTVGAVRDITDRKERERYTDVLNRLLRHNLRNDLTVVAGYADSLAERVDGEEGALAADLREVTADLVELTGDAKRIERLHDRGVDVVPVAVAPAVARAVEDGREAYPDATFTADVPEGLAALADDALETVVGRLVDNAAAHNPVDRPRVHVDAAAADGRITIAVDDDGPGIPREERAVVTGDRNITQLAHGSGLGLWLVRWTVEAYGGELRFGESDLGGTRVVIDLERAESTDAAAE